MDVRSEKDKSDFVELRFLVPAINRVAAMDAAIRVLEPFGLLDSEQVVFMYRSKNSDSTDGQE
ncbi:MAG: hypothetical protein WCA08_18020 [Desulfoferrobacter sp.]